MKLNCGPTLKTRKRLREQAAKDRIKTLVETGEIVFAFLPVRIEENHCMWLEKVRRKLIGYKTVNDEVLTTSLHRLEWALLTPPELSPMWKYEVIDGKQTT